MIDWFSSLWIPNFGIETAATDHVSVCASTWARRGCASEVKWPLQSAVCEMLPDLRIHSAGSGDWTDMWQKSQRWRSAPPRTAPPGWSQAEHLVAGRKGKQGIALFISSKKYEFLCNGCESLCSLKKTPDEAQSNFLCNCSITLYLWAQRMVCKKLNQYTTLWFDWDAKL